MRIEYGSYVYVSPAAIERNTTGLGEIQPFSASTWSYVEPDWGYRVRRVYQDDEGQVYVTIELRQNLSLTLMEDEVLPCDFLDEQDKAECPPEPANIADRYARLDEDGREMQHAMLARALGCDDVYGAASAAELPFNECLECGGRVEDERLGQRECADCREALDEYDRQDAEKAAAEAQGDDGLAALQALIAENRPITDEMARKCAEAMGLRTMGDNVGATAAPLTLDTLNAVALKARQVGVSGALAESMHKALQRVAAWNVERAQLEEQAAKGDPYAIAVITREAQRAQERRAMFPGMSYRHDDDMAEDDGD